MNEGILLSEGAQDLSCSPSDRQLHFHSSSTHSTCASAGTDCAVCHHDRTLRERTSLRRSPGLTTDSLDHAGKANLEESFRLLGDQRHLPASPPLSDFRGSEREAQAG